MPKYKILIEYDGSYFKGWQRQKNVLTVQGKLEEAIKSFSNQDVHVYGAGRTDAGVHANGQVAHFDLETLLDPNTIKNAINHFIKPDIAVLAITKVEKSFHARFDAIKKRYLYKIINRDAPIAIMKNRAWLIKDVMNIKLMIEASKILVGTHNFSSFRAAACQSKSPIKTVDDITIEKVDELITIAFQGKSFLHNQVRIMVSALKQVATAKWSINRLQEVLMAKDRKVGPETAPPSGLYLDKVWYN